MTLTSTQALAFGKFVAASGGNVTVTPGGARSASGGVILVPSAPGSAAQFIATGTPSLTYAITLPANGVVALTQGSNSMAVNNFTSSPPGVGQLGAAGTQTVLVGATLSVGSNQATGSYSGAFTVTVNYN